MPKASYIQTAFNGGELSPTLEGRVDLAKYANGCAKMENFFPLVPGGALKRSGTRFVKEVKTSANATRLIPFEFGTTQAYILEFGNLYMRVYKDGGAVIEATKAISATTNATPVAVTTATHGYTTGDEIYIPPTGEAGATGIPALDGKFWVITVTGVTTFTLDGSTDPGLTSTTGTSARVFTLVTTYTTASLDAIQFAQSADILYLAHPDFLPRKLTRTAHDAWTLEVIVFDFVPFSPTNMDDTLLVTSSGAANSFTDSTCDTTVDPTVAMDDTSAVCVGQGVTGDGIPADTTVASVTDATHFELSQAATAIANNVTLTFTGVCLTADTALFTSSMVAGEFRLAEIVGSNHGQWEGASTNTQYTGTTVAAITGTAHFGGNVYLLDDKNSEAKSGTSAPIHETGIESDGRWDWEYLHSGDGYVTITAVDADGYRATANVIKRLPTSVTAGDRIITGASVAAEVVITTATAHRLSANDKVWIQDVAGMTEINDRKFTVGDVADSTHFELLGEDSTVFTDATCDTNTNTTVTMDSTAALTVGQTVLELSGGTIPAGTTVAAIDADGITFTLSAAATATAVNVTLTFGHAAYTSGGIAVKLQTHRWSHGAWTGRNGYPRSVTFFEDRLWWAGTAGDPQTLWASQTGDYENHKVVDLDESALIFTINTDQVNVIEWINSGKVLTIGTAGGEFICSASSETEALVPGNVRVVRHSTYGSKPAVNPVRIEQSLLFAQRSGRKLRELTFDDAVNAYVAPDMTVLADHVTLGSIKRLAFQQEPNRILWTMLADGDLAAFTYDRAQQVTAWHRHTVGGTNTKVESIAVIPHPDGDQDQLWMIVSRTINGATKRYIEYLSPDWLRSNALTAAFFVDCGLTYEDTATTTITGLEHLEGESVTILANGATHPNKTVSSGAITLDVASSVVHIGLSYSSTLQTMRIEAGAADGTAQGKTKRITNIVLRLDQTGSGLLYGPTDTDADMDELHLRDSLDPMDAGIPLFDGDTEILSWPEGYEQLGRVTLKHTSPLPCTVTAIMPQLNTQDR